MKVIHLKAAELFPVVVDLPEPHNYKDIQNLVGGIFDLVHPDYYCNGVLAKYDVWVNDDGIALNLLPNVALNPKEMKRRNYNYAGLLFGDIVVAGHDAEGETTGIDEGDITQVMEELHMYMLLNMERKTAIENSNK